MHRSAGFYCAVLGLAAAIGPSAAAAAPARSPAALSDRIDQVLSRYWAEHDIEPSPPANDAEFLRRVSLDLTGRIPRVAEVRDFLADRSNDKRQRLIDVQLDDPLYVQHFARVWRAILLSQASAPDLRALAPYLEVWLQRQLRSEAPYDALVRELLTLPLGDRLTSSSSAGAEPTPLAFYQANELKPENLASATSRVFLGVNLECAQCHNHPFADWKQDQFWQFAAFFAGVKRLRPDNAMAAAAEEFDRRDSAIPGTDRVVTAKFLDGSAPEWSPETRPREALAAWITSPKNSYFARAAANRIWSHFFGRGLVEPLDELGGRVTPSQPELLDALAVEFVASGYDFKFLIRAITGSTAYQRSSQQTHASQADKHAFAQMPTRSLTPEQLFDSLALATGCAETHRARILSEFAGLDRPTEAQTSILQALSLMNGELIGVATNRSNGRVLLAVLDAPFLDNSDKIETLFLATLSRPPTQTESAEIHAYLSQSTSSDAALEDVFWALLNSSEFVLNH